MIWGRGTAPESSAGRSSSRERAARPMPAYHFQKIEPQVAGLLGASTRPSRPETSSPAGPSSTSSTCSPIPAARACTSATPKATPPPISSAATSGCAASTCCTRWAGTPSACPPSSTPSRPTRPPPHHDPGQHRHLPPPDQVARLLLRLGPRGRHHRPRLLQVDAVDLPADLRHLVRPRLRLDRCPGAEHARARAGRSPSCRSRQGVPTRTPTAIRSAWPTAPRSPSTGARRWGPCWPTRR